MLTPGDLLGDRYRLEEHIAAGGMGDVWRATDTVLARRVAIKVLRPRGPGAATFGARFTAEARTMAALRHPGIAEVYDYGEEDGAGEGVAYLVMAYVDGEPLAGRIAARGPLPAGETMSIVAQAATALDAAHAAGVVHRDVKPGNLLIGPDGGVVLVDFGVARSTGAPEATDATALTGVDEVVGTALYMAPEQVTKSDISPAADIYALGAVAYHCLAGHAPFTGTTALAVAMSHVNDDPPPLSADVPPAVRALVVRAMAKNPADRFPSAAALARAAREAAPPAGADFASADAGSGDAVAAGARRIAAPPASTEAIPAPVAAGEAPPSRRRRWALAGAAAVVLALVALAGALALMNPAGNAPGTGEGPGGTPAPSASTHPTRPASGRGEGPPQVRSSGPSATASGEPTPTGGPVEGSAPAAPEPSATATGEPAGPTGEPSATRDPTPESTGNPSGQADAGTG
ncbi:serine/threonine-protein kinase [Rhizomonospora bruguierae]|uniref:serine/threonine-protein kinase n=1 Tax=Rhizomonospora bruguierae TaxID=1581705 RepID=UPI001BCB3015|nr:serine/threonine-protein kinase [Micromonospora sp. NBRC 107566]